MRLEADKAKVGNSLSGLHYVDVTKSSKNKNNDSDENNTTIVIDDDNKTSTIQPLVNSSNQVFDEQDQIYFGLAPYYRNISKRDNL